MDGGSAAPNSVEQEFLKEKQQQQQKPEARSYMSWNFKIDSGGM